MYPRYKKEDTLQEIIDTYKNETFENLTFDEIKGIAKTILESLCIYEDIWTEEFVKNRNELLNPIEDIFYKDINAVLKKSLDNTALEEKIKKNVISAILPDLHNYLIKNTIY